MPYAPPRIHTCGRIVPAGQPCPDCTAARNKIKDKGRPTARSRGYTSEWEKARAAFLAEYPRCIQCPEPATYVDHDPPHKGDMAAFWNKSTWFPMCRRCHSRKTAAHDGGFGNPVRCSEATSQGVGSNFEPGPGGRAVGQLPDRRQNGISRR